MKRFVSIVLMLGLTAFTVQGLFAADAKDAAKAKEALQALQDFIGEWKGSGGPDKPKPSPKDPIWKETLKWGWKFKGDDCWLVVDVKDGKEFKSGEMRYLVDKKKYQFTAVDKAEKKRVYEGELKDGLLTLERVDPDTKDTMQIQMNVAGDGVRFIVRTAHKKEGTTIYLKDTLVAATKEGESLGAKEKKNLCVVSGGVGTQAISYKGETFYVCCSGCAEAFRENPEKYIAEFKAKKGK
jgi:YHS domain